MSATDQPISQEACLLDNATLACSAILQRRLSHRTEIDTAELDGAGALGSTKWGASLAQAREREQPGHFDAVMAQSTDDVVLPNGYTFDLLVRWGDSLFPDTPSISAEDLRRGALHSPGAAQRQARQFGANCDA